MSGSDRSGSDRDGYRGPDGGQGGGYRRDGGGYGAAGDEYAPYQDRPRRERGGYTSRGYRTGGYESGAYATGGYESGNFESGNFESGGYESGGGYRTGGFASGGGYRSRRSGSGPYQRETGPYQTGTSSGQYGRDTGGYRTDSGGYRTDSGGYRTDSGGYRTDSGGYRSGSGSYRSGSGGYRTGSHRVVRDRRSGRRWAAILGGAAAALVVCVLAAFVILSGLGGGGEDEGGQVASGATESAPMSKNERSAVPDSCTIVGQDVIDRLAPGSERNEADNYQSSDRQNQCVWGAYAGKNKRQLTVELRAIEASGGQTATDTATATFISERTADESGKSLLAGQELTDKIRLDDVGNDGYVVYSVDDGQGSGEAIGNVRLGNVLITIHYSGSNDGDPLSSDAASDGAIEVARAVIQGLNQS